MVKKGNVIKDIALVILGNMILSVGVAFFFIPNNTLSAGVSGVAVAIHPFIPVISTSTLISILTVVLFVIGALILGKNFALKTLISSIVYPLCVSVFENFASYIQVTNDPILASFYGGVLIGIGVGLVFRGGGSTGGMDIPALLLNKFLHIPLATAVMMVDSSIVILGMALHGIEPALIGLISVFASSYTVNKTMMLGTNTAKSVMIISEKNEEILAEIYKTVDRGATFLHGEGGYTRQNRNVLMVVILQKQFPEVNRIIRSIDPGAFVIVQDVNEVQGQGFSYGHNEPAI